MCLSQSDMWGIIVCKHELILCVDSWRVILDVMMYLESHRVGPLWNTVCALQYSRDVY